MHFEDSFTADANAQETWDFLTSPDDFARTIPDLKEYQIIDDRQFRAVFRISLGVIKSTIDMIFVFEEMQPTNFLKIVGRGSGPQVRVEVTISLNLSPSDGNTRVTWAATSTVGGPLASVGSRLLESTTRSKIREVVEGVKRELGKKAT